MSCLLCLALLSSCAGRFGTASFEPGVSYGNAMDETHDKYFKIADPRAETADEKAGYVIIGIAAVGAAIATAVIVPLAMNGKL